MTPLMQALYTYLEDNLLPDYLSGKYHFLHYCTCDLREQALRDTLTDAQKKLLEQYQDVEGQCADLRELAIFQATLALSGALKQL